jgi:Mg-chelatase subunit ChlD
MERLVLCLDVSGSMQYPFSHKDYGGPRRIDALKEAVKILIKNSSRDHCALGVVTYSGKANLIYEPTKEYGLVLHDVAQMNTGSMTMIGEGLSLAGKVFQNKGGQKRIILLSDGQETMPTGKGHSAQTIVMRELLPRGVIVDCIGIGQDVDIQLLEWISRKTGGVCVHPKTVQELNEHFKQLETRNRKMLVAQNPST